MLEIKTQKYNIKYTKQFMKDYKKILKQDKDIRKLKEIVQMLSSGFKLDLKYRNHKLIGSRKYKNCYECHIEPDWLLVYKYIENELILLLIDTGSHSDLF